MQRFGILGTLLMVSCGGHLDLGKDAVGGTGGTGAMQVTGGSGGEESAMGGATSTGGGEATTGGATAATGGAGSSDPTTRCAQVKAVSATGIWAGYSEDFLFKPIDKYRVEITGVDESGSLCGSVTFADTEPPPAATDPAATYPAGSDPAERKASGISELWPGATYSIIDGAERSAVVRFEVSPHEVMNSWCALQTSYPSAEGTYGCLPGSGFSVSGDSETRVGVCTATNPDGTEFQTTAARCYQCASNCVCSESGCRSRSDRPIVFDLTLSQDESEMAGTVGGTSLQLARVP